MTNTTGHKRQGNHPDRAVNTPDEDRYGFTHIATQLAKAIKGIGREGSAVIGIEGAWGTGKTSLLNLLRTALDKQKEDKEKTFVLNISPWLDGSDTPLVASLLLPVASIIAAEEESRLSPEELAGLRQKKSLTRTARTLMDYTRATARHLAPVAQAAAIVPGVPDASGALKALSESRWLKEKEKTTAEMRNEIAAKIEELDLSFIVLLDDLDRLEPAQAVEVIRLVKSVADFPRFRYLLCYDKAILTQAISQGLGIADGSLYLQKIVQISFGLPRPEAFVLRREFLEAAIRLFNDVNGFPPGPRVQRDLKSLADIYGGTLKTPREVQIALNALDFRYASMRDYVYFPDLCFLQLIRTTNPGLYGWVEEYLSERAVVEARDGRISTEEQKVLLESLQTHLSLYFPAEAHTGFALSQWVPGVSGGLENLPIKLFGKTSEQESVMMTAGKRLGSQAYWRYYFAFSAPQNVLPPTVFDQLFEIAAHPGQQQELADTLLGYVQIKKFSSRTWFEHILTQLTAPLIETRTYAECRGLLQFLFNYGDEVLERYRADNHWFAPHDLDTYGVADRLIIRMIHHDSEETMTVLTELIMEGRAWYWIAEYFRHLLWQHGLAGDRVPHQQESWMEADKIDKLRGSLAERLNNPDITSLLPDFPLLSAYIWAWRDISGNEVVGEWVDSMTGEDEAFLKLLLQLRYHGTSSEDGNYRALKLSDMALLLGDRDKIEERIDHIRKEEKFSELVGEVEQAIKRNRF
ncbi:P-loop NTPase fold protein [Enterobacter sp.]|uniref:KAP family P-loop NTPase fold protein n=1 Tax=Enterobacter sp. TaxID=42895 RepID=UPI00296F5ACE|nr:P-loop NTPase fold protein [Enterobacter sp.]